MSSEARGGRQPPLREYRRRKALPDLNAPPVVPRDEASSSLAAAAQGIGGGSQLHGQPEPPAAIDVEAIDDDVIVSSPRSFAEAKHNAAMTRGVPVVVDLDSERAIRRPVHIRNKRRRVSTRQTIINCDYYINLEGSGSCSSKSGTSQPQPQTQPLPPPPPPPPLPPTFTCPICMSPFVEETSTKCGHIFCKVCIKSALAVQAKCPTCRKKVVAKDLIRVFLPSTASA